MDPFLSESSSPFSGSDVTHAGLILCSHAGCVDPQTVPAILAASPRSKLVLPKSAAAHANSLGVPYARMVTTDSGLRVEYLDDRVYAVPSARDKLDWTPLGVEFKHNGCKGRFGNRRRGLRRQLDPGVHEAGWRFWQKIEDAAL